MSQFCENPVRLETDRLVLDGHRATDFDDIFALWTDLEVVRHIGSKPSTAQECWMRLLRYRGLWPLLGFGYWAVREKESGRFVGDLGFADFHRDMTPSIAGLPEAGWVVAGWAQGRGYANEALAAALAWLDAAGHGQTVAIIDAGNLRSLRLAARQGFLESAVATLGEQQSILLRRHRPCA